MHTQDVQRSMSLIMYLIVRTVVYRIEQAATWRGSASFCSIGGCIAFLSILSHVHTQRILWIPKREVHLAKRALGTHSMFCSDGGNNMLPTFLRPLARCVSIFSICCFEVCIRTGCTTFLACRRRQMRLCAMICHIDHINWHYAECLL